MPLSTETTGQIKCKTSEDHAGDLNIMLQISKNMLCHLLCKTAVSLVKSP